MLRLPTQAEIDQLLSDLNRLGEEFEPREYGLPLFDEPSMGQMRQAVIGWLSNLDQTPVLDVFQVTMASWMKHGPMLVKTQGVQALRIIDRWPHNVVDPITLGPDGGYGWQFGWRWQDDQAECSRWTLPEDIYRHLPKCPYPVSQGVMPRWPTVQEANAALTTAALDWARARLDTNGRGEEVNHEQQPADSE